MFTHRHHPHRSYWGPGWLSCWTLKHCTIGLCWWLCTWIAEEWQTNVLHYNLPRPFWLQRPCSKSNWTSNNLNTVCDIWWTLTSRNWLNTGNRGHVFPRRSPSMHLAVFKSKLLWSFSCWNTIVGNSSPIQAQFHNQCRCSSFVKYNIIIVTASCFRSEWLTLFIIMH